MRMRASETPDDNTDRKTAQNKEVCLVPLTAGKKLRNPRVGNACHEGPPFWHLFRVESPSLVLRLYTIESQRPHRQRDYTYITNRRLRRKR